jgi:chorismate--pyruvate lyase
MADGGSLTAALRASVRGHFNVQVLHHAFSPVPASLACTLGIAVGDPILQREVVLCDDQVPLVFACSLLPEIALTGRFEALRALGTQPLGHWIFQEPALVRQSVRHASLPGVLPLFCRLSKLTSLPTRLPGRKTEFYGAERPFLVTEFFMPALRDRQPHRL